MSSRPGLHTLLWFWWRQDPRSMERRSADALGISLAVGRRSRESGVSKSFSFFFFSPSLRPVVFKLCPRGYNLLSACVYLARGHYSICSQQRGIIPFININTIPPSDTIDGAQLLPLTLKMGHNFSHWHHRWGHSSSHWRHRWGHNSSHWRHRTFSSPTIHSLPPPLKFEGH